MKAFLAIGVLVVILWALLGRDTGKPDPPPVVKHCPAVPLICPLEQGCRITSAFGMRWHPILKRRALHTGADWRTGGEVEVRAMADGVIEATGFSKSYGRWVLIRHDGFSVFYAHLSRRFHAQGVRVRQGQIVALSGTTGRSTGHHLHAELRIHDTGNRYGYAVADPQRCLPTRLAAQAG